MAQYGVMEPTTTRVGRAVRATAKVRSNLASKLIQQRQIDQLKEEQMTKVSKLRRSDPGLRESMKADGVERRSIYDGDDFFGYGLFSTRALQNKAELLAPIGYFGTYYKANSKTGREVATHGNCFELSLVGERIYLDAAEDNYLRYINCPGHGP